MSDWPGVTLNSANGSISTLSAVYNRISTLGASAAWPSANTAYFVPFALGSPFIARKMAFGCGTTAGGNCDVGIYDTEGNRIVSSGATARSASSEVIVDITDTYLDRGIYYMAMSHDGTNNIVFVTPSGTSPVPLQKARLAGVVQMASAYVLPATATFAAVSSAIIPSVAIYGASY